MRRWLRKRWLAAALNGAVAATNWILFAVGQGSHDGHLVVAPIWTGITALFVFSWVIET